MLTFVGKVADKPHVNHINGDTSDNRLENLEWVTRSRNSQHAFDIGLNTHYGENHHKAKLTNVEELQIRDRISAGESNASIAKSLGVSAVTISHIKTGKTRRHTGRVVHTSPHHLPVPAMFKRRYSKKQPGHKIKFPRTFTPELIAA
jgi:hypothetical protein